LIKKLGSYRPKQSRTCLWTTRVAYNES